MSFDLYRFPPSGPTTVPQVRQLQAAEEQRIMSGQPESSDPPGPEMASFLEELERRWPSLGDDPGNSPWSSWPLWQPMTGGGSALNIRWSRADSARTAILEIAARSKVIIYDPQYDEVITPPPV